MKALVAVLLNIFLFKFNYCFEEIVLNCELVNKKLDKSTCVNFDLQVSNEQAKVISINPVIKDTKITAIHLQSNLMHYLPMGIFDHFPHLEELRIFTEKRRLMQLDARNFKRVSNLKKIYVTNQQLKSLGPKIFADAAGVLELYLPLNRIETINSKAFEGLVECRFIGLNNNKIRVIKVDVFHTLPKLTHLNLDGNRIKELPNTIFAGSPNIVVFELAGNLLEQIPVLPVKKVLFGEKIHNDYYPTVTLDDNACPSLKNIYGQVSEAEIMTQHASCINMPSCMSECLYTNQMRRSHIPQSAQSQQSRSAFETIEDMVNEEERLLGMQFMRVEVVIKKLESFLQDNPAEIIVDSNDFDMKVVYKNHSSELNEDMHIKYKHDSTQPSVEDFVRNNTSPLTEKNNNNEELQENLSFAAKNEGITILKKSPNAEEFEDDIVIVFSAENHENHELDTPSDELYQPQEFEYI